MGGIEAPPGCLGSHQERPTLVPIVMGVQVSAWVPDPAEPGENPLESRWSLS